MDIKGRNVLVLGGAGLVGMAVCRALLVYEPARLAVASRRTAKARDAAADLAKEFAGTATKIVALAGDVFIRAEWQTEGAPSRTALLADAERRKRLIADLLDPLDEDIVTSSLLVRMVTGAEPDGTPAEIVIDCMNTATIVSYQNIYALARDLADNSPHEAVEVAPLLASLYVPQLVRHVQLLFEAMRRAGTQAYVKVGTSGTGGMGFNIPYTHGEEKPSRLLLSKAALAGAQSLLTFLMARTPGGPAVVKEIKPAAVIGWREIGHGPVRPGGRDLALVDCPVENSVAVDDPANLVAEGKFGEAAGGILEGVYIDTGENGQFTAAEFAAITALGQMELVTPEEIADNVVRELAGGSSGRDIVGALDGAVMGPSYRGGYLRQMALERLRELEAEHGEAVAFEVLGPPRLSKLLFEAFLLKRACGTRSATHAREAKTLAGELESLIAEDASLRRHILSIGLGILLADGKRLLRGPVLKSSDSEHGWVDLRAANMKRWQDRLADIERAIAGEDAADTSSRRDRSFAAGGADRTTDDIDIAGVVAWIMSEEEKGRRGKR